MIQAVQEGTGLKKLDLLESRIRALLEERDRLRARVEELEPAPRRHSQEGHQKRDFRRLLEEREDVRRKIESLLGAVQRFRAEDRA